MAFDDTPKSNIDTQIRVAAALLLFFLALLIPTGTYVSTLRWNASIVLPRKKKISITASPERWKFTKRHLLRSLTPIKSGRRSFEIRPTSKPACYELTCLAVQIGLLVWIWHIFRWPLDLVYSYRYTVLRTYQYRAKWNDSIILPREKKDKHYRWKFTKRHLCDSNQDLWNSTNLCTGILWIDMIVNRCCTDRASGVN